MQVMGLKTTASFGFLLFGLGFVGGIAKPTLHWDMNRFGPSSSKWQSLG